MGVSVLRLNSTIAIGSVLATGCSTYSSPYFANVFTASTACGRLQLWLGSIRNDTLAPITSRTAETSASSCRRLPLPTFNFKLVNPCRMNVLASSAAMSGESDAMRAFAGTEDSIPPSNSTRGLPCCLPSASNSAVSTPNCRIGDNGISRA